MKKLATTVFVLCLLLVQTAAAEQKLRVQVDQRGDFVMIGNTLGWDCAANAATPVVGTTDNSLGSFVSCGLLSTDTSPDLFWRADEPSAGKALASSNFTSADARTTAVLTLPKNAKVTHAFLYWGARRSGTAADNTATIERPGSFSMSVTATATYAHPAAVTSGTIYESVADVTSLVVASGSGAYRVGGIDTQSFPDSEEDVLFGGWALVVLYQLDTEPLRNLAIFDGLDSIDTLGTTSDVSLSGFLVPNAGFDAKLGTIVYEGDNAINGDTLRFGKAPLAAADNLSDMQNPSDNFFNGTRSLLGMPVSVMGDLPQLKGTAGTMAGIDLDVIDVTSKVKAGQKSVDLQALTFLDAYFMGAFITSITTFKPDFTTSTKSVKDVNGGAAKAGDELEYTIDVKNTGNDDSIDSVMSDVLPMGVTFVSGSLEIKSGAGMGKLTDASGDDAGEYDSAKRTVTVRVGSGATASKGGSIASAATVSVVFRVKIDMGVTGVISNQASIEAAGKKGSPPEKTLTDGNGNGPGAPPTETPVGECTNDSQCSMALPICDVKNGVCVGCTSDMQCAGTMSHCDVDTMMCVCSGSAASCMDSDGDGASDPDEVAAGTDPMDRDSDDDGVADGAEPSWNMDSDGDGLINALDPDSDDDALYDGTELGLGCDGVGTDKTEHHCIADADSDGGGERDGSEDENLDGKLDMGERDPTTGHGGDDNGGGDMDGDGLSDGTEDAIGTDKNDADSDDDGLIDGQERNPADDTDGDGLVNALDPDSDDDALPDGLEAGKDCGNAATKPGHCTPDADPSTTTSPVDRDTDNGGASDGSEDVNRNGKLDMGERNPIAGHGDDDNQGVDSDSDGLSDDLEDSLGSNKMDADTDDDGLLDGQENNPAIDTDGDGKINILDSDSDGDSLPDGLENGKDCANPATDTSKGTCTADGDLGATKTSSVNADTDYGSASDSQEDANKNGVVDSGERDPNMACDDKDPMGCTMPMVDAGTGGAGGAAASNLTALGGAGCNCHVAGSAGSRSQALGWWLPLMAAAAWWTRRRTRR
jgi:uncharacterized repeat protein (TIGR01451 family)/MYXO-CTERM domain-containing protein